ncbi:MAG: hypothetical protein LBL66_06315 [Clostridiales bacterium]|nr:hypothetical protein [Clostridiales bacterium]
MRSGNIARGVPLFGRDCRVALRAPRNDNAGRVVFIAMTIGARRALRNDKWDVPLATTPPPLAAPLRGRGILRFFTHGMNDSLRTIYSIRNLSIVNCKL